MTERTYFAHESAYVDDPVEIGAGTKIWHHSHIRTGATIGERCVLGKGVFVDAGVDIGCGVKIQNNVSVYDGVVRGDVPDYALMAGVPAKRKAWMSRHGHRLEKRDEANRFVCPESGWRYQETEAGLLRCLDWPEDKALESSK